MPKEICTLTTKVNVIHLEAVKSLINVLCEHLKDLPPPVINELIKIKDRSENNEW